MPDQPDSFAEETLWLREETQRLIDLSRADRSMCDLLVAQSLSVLPRSFTLDEGGGDLLPQHPSG
jgi:hypothetical protein